MLGGRSEAVSEITACRAAAFDLRQDHGREQLLG